MLVAGARGALAELPAGVVVGAQPFDVVAELGQLRLGEQDGAALVGQPACVGGLMILGGTRPRHEDGRGAGDGGLGDGARPTPPDEEIGRRVQVLDPLVVADHLVQHAGAVDDGGAGEEALADHLAHGQRRVVGVAR